MSMYLKIGKYIINPQHISNVRILQHAVGESTSSHIIIHLSENTQTIDLRDDEALAFLRWIAAETRNITPAETPTIESSFITAAR